MRDKALLVLEDGRAFFGHAYGAHGQTSGETVFSTAMTGHFEALTDPACRGQILTMTAPHIGNTGSAGAETRKIQASGVVVRDPSRIASHWQALDEFEAELCAQGIVGISGLDTRALTRHLRDEGTMRAIISSTETNPATLRDKIVALPTNPASPRAGLEPVVYQASGEQRYRLAVVGEAPQLIPQLTAYGIAVDTMPPDVDRFAGLKADGLIFADGPEAHSLSAAEIALAHYALERGSPVFGIGRGHHILANALELQSYRLKSGHHGSNLPVQELATGKVEITSHHHGAAIAAPREFETQYGPGRVTHVCLNDGVVEGIELTARPAMSVQFQPEAAAGPRDSSHLLDRFIALVTHASSPKGSA